MTLPDPHGCPHCGHAGLAERWGETICGMCGAPRQGARRRAEGGGVMWANVSHETFAFCQREMHELNPNRRTILARIGLDAAFYGGDFDFAEACILPFDAFEVELLTPENWRESVRPRMRCRR